MSDLKVALCCTNTRQPVEWFEFESVLISYNLSQYLLGTETWFYRKFGEDGILFCWLIMSCFSKVRKLINLICAMSRLVDSCLVYPVHCWFCCGCYNQTNNQRIRQEKCGRLPCHGQLFIFWHPYSVLGKKGGSKHSREENVRNG